MPCSVASTLFDKNAGEQLWKVERSQYDHAGHDYAQHSATMRLGMQQVMCVMYIHRLSRESMVYI